MSVEILTYGALGARLNISPVAARSLARRLRLPRSRSDDGKALVSVDLAEIKHKPQPPGRRQARRRRSVDDNGRGIARGDRAARSKRGRSPRRFRARTRARRSPDGRAACRRPPRPRPPGRRRRGSRGRSQCCGPVPAPIARSTRRNAGSGSSLRPWWTQTARLRVGSYPFLIPPPGGAIVGRQ